MPRGARFPFLPRHHVEHSRISMRFLKVYGRVISLLGPEWRTGALLALANLAIAGVGFLDPILFGRVIDLLSHAAEIPFGQLWDRAAGLLGPWAAVGLGSIGASMM